MQQRSNTGTRALGILFFSMLMGQVIFALLAYYMNASGTMIVAVLADNGKNILVAIAGLALLLAIGSFIFYRKKITAAKESAQTVQGKLDVYRSANIIRWALLEAPVLLAIIAFMLSGNKDILFVIAAMLLLFISTKPSVAKAAAALSLSEEEVNV